MHRGEDCELYKKISIGKVLNDIREMFNNDISYIIDKYCKVEKEKQIESLDGYLSASNIPYLCLREEYFALLNGTKRGDNIDAKLRLIFETGNAFQDIFRDIIAPSGILFGMWRCCSCDYVHGSVDGSYTINSRGAKEAKLLRRISWPKKCQFCGEDKFEYIEETIVNESFKIAGHPDGFLMSKVYNDVLEIKTVNENRYRQAKKAPFDEHLEQAMFYAWATLKKYVLFVYFNKNNGDYCVHRKRVDQQIISNMLSRIDAYRAMKQEYRKYGTIESKPERVCKTNKTFRAQKCEFCKICFLSER